VKTNLGPIEISTYVSLNPTLLSNAGD